MLQYIFHLLTKSHRVVCKAATKSTNLKGDASRTRTTISIGECASPLIEYMASLLLLYAQGPTLTADLNVASLYIISSCISGCVLFHSVHPLTVARNNIPCTVAQYTHTHYLASTVYNRYSRPCTHNIQRKYNMHIRRRGLSPMLASTALVVYQLPL